MIISHFCFDWLYPADLYYQHLWIKFYLVDFQQFSLLCCYQLSSDLSSLSPLMVSKNSLLLLCPPLVWGLAGALVVRPIHLALGRVSLSLPCHQIQFCPGTHFWSSFVLTSILWVEFRLILCFFYRTSIGVRLPNHYQCINYWIFGSVRAASLVEISLFCSLDSFVSFRAAYPLVRD